MDRQKVAPYYGSTVPYEPSSHKNLQVSTSTLSGVPGIEPEETLELRTMSEANGCLPLASSKEVQTSLLNISLNNTSSSVTTSNKSELVSSKNGRGKYERGHQLSKVSASKEADLETRKEVGKLIFKMGEELRDLSKKAIVAPKLEHSSKDLELDLLQPHCSNPLCRHNCPSTTVVSLKSTPQQSAICMCGRTMTMISRAPQEANPEPKDSIISDVS